MKKTSNKSAKTNGQSSANAGQGQAGRETSGKSPSFLQKFFIDQLKDIYYAEKELIKALPEMQKACTSEELEDAIENHIKQTERHVKRLDKVFQSIGKKAEGKRCEAIDGLLKEGRDIINETEESSMTRDAAMIIAQQKIEHYEIATYGGLVQLAVTMDLHRAAELLDRTLQEEEETDRLLTDIAESYINVEAEQEGDYEWETEEEHEPATTARAF